MPEYIEREAIIAEFKRLTLGENSLIERVFADGVYAVLETFPASDVAEVKRGGWVDSEIREEKYVCSVCGGACWYYDYHGDVAKSRYCPNCGAKMDGKEIKK